MVFSFGRGVRAVLISYRHILKIVPVSLRHKTNGDALKHTPLTARNSKSLRRLFPSDRVQLFSVIENAETFQSLLTLNRVAPGDGTSLARNPTSNDDCTNPIRRPNKRMKTQPGNKKGSVSNKRRETSPSTGKLAASTSKAKPKKRPNVSKLGQDAVLVRAARALGTAAAKLTTAAGVGILRKEAEVLPNKTPTIQRPATPVNTPKRKRSARPIIKGSRIV